MVSVQVITFETFKYCLHFLFLIAWEKVWTPDPPPPLIAAFCNCFINKLTNYFLKNDLALTVYFDLSKAFDTLDHDILLHKLDCNGFRGPPQSWFTSYLKNRFQKFCR